ncbi:S8 family serine peptidase [Paenibacillus sp. GM2]|uniref:S8 family serine peptidase n=1 Tax=Paenibacillus sp. GM2 TaxID=1622070 RepID=UPI0008390CEA|nr:S8 family serine peptidase [Paenibacillus sp. GM2]
MNSQFKSEVGNKKRNRRRKIMFVMAVVLLLVTSPGHSGVLAAVMEGANGAKAEQEYGNLISPVSVTDITYHPLQSLEWDEGITSGDPQSRLIMFKEGRLPAYPEELLQQWPDIEITLLPEVSMLKLTGYSLDRLLDAEAALTAAFASDIEEVGEDPKITISDQATDPLQDAGIASKKTYNILNLNRPQFPSARRQEAADSVTGSSPLAAGAPLYQSWGWDIKEVTGDGQSLSMQSGNHNVVVAVIDSGIDASHPDLSGNVVNGGRSFVPGVNDTIDRLGHGTMIAGTIAANGQLLGVGPNLGISAYKVFDEGEADSSWVVEAIIQAVRDKVDVINLSLGTYKSLIKREDQAILIAYERALAYAYLHGVVVVASSGTDGLDISNPFQLAENLGWGKNLAVHAPGGLPGVITVSATNREHERAFYSNYGLRNMIAAPAGDYGSTWFTKGELNLLSMCLTTYPTNLPQSYLSQLVGLPAGYEFMIGTSLAAPKVSAAAALLIAEGREKGKPMSPEDVKQILFRSATDYGVTGPDTDFGVGVVNVYEALKNTMSK